MLMSEMLSSAMSWPLRQVQQYKTKEQLQAALNLLQQSFYEAERQRHAEEIKALKLERELQYQRERLGRDLHDGFGSQLTHIISRLDLMACTGTADPDQIQRLSEFTREMNFTLRETIWLLDHESIKLDAFGARLYSMMLRVWDEREVPKLNWQFIRAKDNSRLSPPIALCMIRITQEGINNALKYANATQVKVEFIASKSNLSLNISDNGCGFDASTTRKGLGLNNMRKRTEELSGSFDLATSTSGTTIKAVLPLTT